MRPVPTTRLNNPQPNGATTNDDSSIPFHAVENGHNRPYAELSTEAVHPGLNRLLHEMDRGGSLRQHNRKISPTVRREKHHLSPWPALRNSDRQRFPVHIKKVSEILRKVEDSTQHVESAVPAEQRSSRGIEQDHNRRIEEMPRLEKRMLDR